jgi:exoribonuclease R
MEFFPPHISKTQLHLDDSITIKKVNFKNGEIYDETGSNLKNNRAIHGDTVYINNLEVVGIKQPSKQDIVGILHLNKSQKYGFTKRGIPIIKFTPLSNKYPTFMVPSKSKERKALYCVITLNKWETTNKVPIGQIEKIIGPVGNKKCEVEAILYKNSVFPRRVKLSIKDDLLTPVGDSVTNIYQTFSVDPDGCRDIDDAFHVTSYDSGVEIGIHIADVASRLNMDNPNINFFSSIYLDAGQINMLPDKLTFDEASLGNGEIKRAVSLIINYDYCQSKNKYCINNFKFQQTIVKNKALTYKQADHKISQGTCKFKALYDIMKQFSETDDSLHKIPATKIVEYYMLLYNTKVAELLYRENPATILRRHAKADVCSIGIKHSEELTNYLTRIQQNAAEYIRGDSVEDTASLSHESLGFNYYTHATSPIRRYVDIINQVNIIRIIDKHPSNFMALLPSDIQALNDFNKNLRKFYNNYKKLKLVFSHNISGNENNSYIAYITQIKEHKIKIYIPALDIDNFVRIVSRKLSKLDFVQVGETDSTPDTFISVTVMGQLLKKYDQIKIAITVLPNEPVFNNKIYCQMIEPNISIL